MPAEPTTRQPPLPGPGPAALPQPGGALEAQAACLLVLICASWGLNQVAVKVAGEAVPPLLQAGLRSLGGAILVWAWCRWRAIRLLQADRTLGLGLLIGLLFTVEFALFYVGIALTTASRGVLFFYTSPFVVALGAHLFVPGEQLDRGRLTGLVLAFGGLSLVFAEGLTLPDRRALLGDLLCLAGAIFWGATTVTIKATRLIRIRPERTLLYQLATSALVLLPAALVAGETIPMPAPLLPIAALVYQTVVVVAVTYLAWMWMITRYDAGRLAAFTFLTPVFGVLFGAVLLAEPIGAGVLAGLALLSLGIWLVNRT
jgi:drug/metabolite transporter (DMT)-like permease